MKRGLVITVAVALGATVGGCAAREAIREGRVALAADNPIVAARHFESALAQKPSLVRDERFMGELTAARRDAAMTRGREFLDAGRYEQAITQFEKARDADPSHAAPMAAISRAHAAAAEGGYRAALAAADRGDLDTARAALTEALRHGPDHAGAARALQLLDDPASARADAVAAWRQATALAAVNDWDGAADRLRTAIAADGDLLVARRKLAEATRVIADAEAKLKEGRTHLEAKRLDRAVETLAAAAELRPHHVPTASALTTAHRLRSEAQAVVDDATAALINREFDLALSMIAHARGLYPEHPELADLESRTRDAAAAEHTQRGDALLTEGHAEEAEAAFTLALRYRDAYEPARAGLASIATARAEAAAGDGWWGSALLYHLDAYDLLDTPAHRDAVARAREKVIDRAGAALRFRRATNGGEQAPFEDRVLATLRNDRRGGLLRLVDGRGEEPHHHVTVTLTRLHVDRSLVTSAHRAHPYHIENLIPNPAIPGLRRAVWEARSDVHRAEHIVRDRRAAYRDAAAHAQQHTASERAAQKLDNRRDELRAAERELDHAEAEFRRLDYELSCAPAMVVEVVAATWPYTHETYELEGVLTARVVVTDADGENELAAETIEARFEASDETTRGGNPALGLPDDPLQLPAERDVRARLIEDAAAEAAAVAADLVLEARLAAAEAYSRESAARNEPTIALEAEVDAAIVLGGLDRAAGARRLEALRRESGGGPD